MHSNDQIPLHVTFCNTHGCESKSLGHLWPTTSDNICHVLLLILKGAGVWPWAGFAAVLPSWIWPSSSLWSFLWRLSFFWRFSFFSFFFSFFFRACSAGQSQ